MPRKTTRRPYDRVNHFDLEEHPVDELLRRDPRQQALREKVAKAKRRLEQALGRQRGPWLQLEEALVELAGHREELMFDTGYTHGFAAGRAEAMASTPETRVLAGLLRDLAIQHLCPRQVAVAALLEAAWSLVTLRKTGRRVR